MKKDILVQQLVNSFGNWVRTDCENRAGGTARMTRDLYPYTSLFSPIRINKLTVKNRLVMAPMGNCQMAEETGRPNDKMLQYFFARAEGGVGLLTTGLIPISHHIDSSVTEKGNYSYFPRIDGTRTNFMGWRDLAQGVHARGSRIFIQLTPGLGRVGNPQCLLTQLQLPVSASWNPNFYLPDVPCRPLTDLECDKIIRNAAQASMDAKVMGMDGVYLHGHEGYLLDQFVMAMTNQRTDEYGGTLENRMRVVKEIIEGIHQTCGDDYPISVRLGLKSYVKAFNKASLTGENEAGRTLEEGIEICKMLESYGVNALSVDVGTYDSFYYACPPAYMPKGHGLELYAKAKEAVKISILAGSRMGDPWICAKALRDGQADAFVLSRPSLADPEFPKKTELGMPEKIRPCIGCNFGCIGRVEDQGLPPACAVNPRAMRESFYPPRKATTPKNIMVVGGGVAGMEATRAAIQAGHTVTLYEKSDHLGGELLAAGNRPLKGEVTDLNLWYQRELKELNANIVLNKEITHRDIISAHPDVVILTVGASSVMPRSIPGIDHPKSVSAIDALEGHKPVGETVVVVGGGEIGCETAMHFALQGKKVSVVEAMPNLMSLEFVPNQCKSMLEDLMEHYHVPVYTGNRLLEINDAGAVIQSADGESKTLEADTVVMSIGMRSNLSMKEALIGTGIEVYEIGSCKKPANIFKAVHDAFELIYNM